VKHSADVWDSDVHTSPDADNPYSLPPHSQPYSVVTVVQVLSAAVSFLFGAASICMGLFGLAVMAFVLRTDQANETAPRMIAGCLLNLGFGVSWLIAGCCYWRRHYRRGLIATALGIMIPVVLFTILGF
jgi:hypothetical protein